MDTNNSLKVLIAEDDYLVSEEIVRLLKNIGYKHIEEATTGVEAVDMVCALRPDVVLMDIQLPKLDGLEATRRIQECCPTPVVVLTAYESQELVKKASEMGVSSYLTKPPRSDEIERAITIALARHGDLMQLRRLFSEIESKNKKLEEALAKVKTLSGLLPICASCKKIRDDKGYWNQIEGYIRDHSEAQFSHGICPECAKKLYPELYEDE